MPPHAVAVGDWFHPPEVLGIDLAGFTGQAGGRIKVQAIDDVAVRSVHLAVRKSDGTVLEQGEAVFADGSWTYTCTTVIPAGTYLIIEATAQDWAGKEGRKNLNYP